jgi:predicted GNAT superfamily acetyltransferase
VAGAFDASGSLVGFIFGMTGWQDGRAIHWSDLVAVDPLYQNLGIGSRLKRFQQAVLLSSGVEDVFWTFDPLVARSAHLNLTRLEARMAEYLVDMYGPAQSGGSGPELGTDRFLMQWRLDGGAVRSEAPAGHTAAAPLVYRGVEGPELRREVLKEKPDSLTIEIPEDLAAIQRDSLSAAAYWRSISRAGFLLAIEAGYQVSGFRRGHEGTPPAYLLTRRAGSAIG